MIFLGADHGGFALKEKMKTWLSEWGMEYEDLGAPGMDPTDDYPDYAHGVAQKVIENPINRGIVVCRSGGGMIIAANKHVGVRAVYIFDEKSARHAREHNDANVAGLAADWISEPEAKTAVDTFLHTLFSEEPRHSRRIEKLEIV
ncbi:MAG: RpiB/LacA/LacB family sugar-phosphate isomerase [Candidatus Woesebacteria bacterium]